MSADMGLGPERTDTERLDWLEKHPDAIEVWPGNSWDIVAIRTASDGSETRHAGPTYRAAIDAAMDAEVER